jgi:putative SOS response-associated peptidase YedK
MCGSLTRNYTWAQIHAIYSLTSPASNRQPRFNICPTDTVDTVVNHELVPMRWGLFRRGRRVASRAAVVLAAQREG